MSRTSEHKWAVEQNKLRNRIDPSKVVTSAFSKGSRQDGVEQA